MTIIAFAGDGIKIVSDGNGVTITKEAENWGDPWPQQETSIIMEMMEMKMTHEDVYVLIEKSLRFETIEVIGVYETYQLASEVAEQLMDIHGEEYGYRIDLKTLVRGEA